MSRYLRPGSSEYRRFLRADARFFVLATGSSKRALRALADESDRLLKLTSLAKIGVESDTEGRWVCLDYSDVVIHFFDRDARAFYDLEHLWGDAPRVEFE